MPKTKFERPLGAGEDDSKTVLSSAKNYRKLPILAFPLFTALGLVTGMNIRDKEPEQKAPTSLNDQEVSPTVKAELESIRMQTILTGYHLNTYDETSREKVRTWLISAYNLNSNELFPGITSTNLEILPEELNSSSAVTQDLLIKCKYIAADGQTEFFIIELPTSKVRRLTSNNALKKPNKTLQHSHANDPIEQPASDDQVGDKDSRPRLLDSPLIPEETSDENNRPRLLGGRPAIPRGNSR